MRPSLQPCKLPVVFENSCREIEDKPLANAWRRKAHYRGGNGGVGGAPDPGCGGGAVAGAGIEDGALAPRHAAS